MRAGVPVRLMEQAVRGMLPKSKLGDAMFRSSRCTPPKSIRTPLSKLLAFEVE